MKFEAPQIITYHERKIIGISMRLSLNKNKVVQLWRAFIPRKNEIINRIKHDLISASMYSKDHFLNFDTTRIFKKWAAIEVSNFDHIPEGMETTIIPGGLYAVFQYRGLSTDPSIFHYIYGTWIPNSIYELDHRPHFEILGKKYKNNDLDSEEEIWIPISVKRPTQ